MSTHYYISRMRKGIRLASPILLSMLGVLGIALQTLLFSSSPVHAASVHRAANSEPPEDVARAGVSIVRLLVTYSTLTATTPIIQCTGVGVIIESWASQGATDQNNWVLTDGALVNPDEASCLSGTAHPKARLSMIEILMSGTYNLQAKFDLTAPVNAPLDVHCAQVGACQNGLALFAFSTDQTKTLPFLDLVPASSGNVDSSTLALVKSTTSLTVPLGSNTDTKNVSTYATTLTQFLTPVKAPTGTSAAVNEVGMPVVDPQGRLVGLHVKNASPISSQDITSFVSRQIKPPAQRSNPVHDSWNAGLTAFYQGQSHYAEARSDFDAVLAANPQFQGVQTFVQLTNSTTSLPPASKGKSGNDTIFGLPGSLVPILWGFVILLVVALAVVISLRLRLRRQPETTPEFQADWVEAERIANATLEEEMRKQQWAQQQAKRMIAEQKTLTPELVPQAFPQHITAQLPCPGCQKPIRQGITSCPYCGVSLLAPTDSGFYPRTQFAMPPHILPGRPNGIENQPTREMSPSLQQVSPSYQQMSPSEPRNGLSDPEKTHPPLVRQISNQNLGFTVVTRTDVGKKRKHKPNEDSLFAAQVVREASHAMQQVGLFVVADGMGGHANGQDASQTAIQSIINALLPKLTQSGELSGEAYKQLLTEGVQVANQAVHQRNLDQRADMGTTMTAALVVAPLGSTYAEDDTRPPAAMAYVANVGDSRTYLYRKTQGLRKLTNDHSVVASLVEAGIIRPDDIYTHPKRNQIYRSLGEKPLVEVDAFMYPLDVDDKLLLCSDGLWDMVRDPKIEEVLKSYEPDANMTGDMLIQAALDGGGEDNVSVIVIHIPDLSRQNAHLGIQLIYKPDPVQLPPM